MKKHYMKPVAELVDFSLASSIANSCNDGSGGTTAPSDEDTFTVAPPICQSDGSISNTGGEGCYQVGQDGFGPYFSS